MGNWYPIQRKKINEVIKVNTFTLILWQNKWQTLFFAYTCSKSSSSFSLFLINIEITKVALT